jgi:hypothetical protein
VVTLGNAVTAHTTRSLAAHPALRPFSIVDLPGTFLEAEDNCVGHDEKRAPIWLGFHFATVPSGRSGRFFSNSQ